MLNETLCIRSSSQSCCSVQGLSSLTDYFLVYLSVIERSIKISHNYCEFVCFSLQFCHLCFMHLEGCMMRPVSLKVLYLMMISHSFHQEVSLEVSLAGTDTAITSAAVPVIAASSFQFVFAQYNFFYSFTFILFVFLNQT